MSQLAGHKGGHGRCITCQHKDRAAIEDAVIGGMAYATAAELYGLSSSALHRHMDRHRSVALVKVEPAELVATGGDSTTNELEALLVTAKAQMASAGSVTQALAALEAALKIVVARGAWHEREMARRPSVVVNLLTTPAWIELRTKLMEALAPYEAARIAVSNVLNGEQ